MTFTCAEIREMLPAHVRGEAMTLAVRRHLARCEGCRAELARYDEVATMLSGLRVHVAEPPADLLPALLDPHRPRRDVVVRHVARNRRAYTGGAVALLGAAGAVAWAARSRRPATA